MPAGGDREPHITSRELRAMMIRLKLLYALLLASLAMSPNAIPVFYKLDANGKPTGDKIDGGAWGDNIPDNMAPPLKAFFAK